MNELVSEYRVMRSNAGYYIGQEYWDTEIGDGVGYWFPYDRVSGYFPDRDSALDILREFVYNDLTETDSDYIMSRIYFEDPVSFWHLIPNYS